jgi:predicted ribosome quality control (RQC) complex YloA/Tae2 family protein
MLSFCELERAARILDSRIAGHRLQALTLPDGSSVVLTCYGKEAGRQHVRLSGRPGFARVSMCPRKPKGGAPAGALAQYLRAHVVGGTVRGVRIVGDDRQLAIDVGTEEGAFTLLLAILGKRSNLYLLDGDECVVASMRPLSETRPELAAGDVWRTPSSKPPTRGEDRFEEESDDGFLEAVEAAYAESEDTAAGDSLRRELENVFRREGRTLTRKLEKLDRELEAARSAENLERQGELLKGVLSQVRRGDSQVVARDYETGEEVAIALDPVKSPAENLEALFKRYRKAIRTLTKAGAQQQAVREASEELQTAQREFEALGEGDTAALQAFAERPAVRRLLSRYASRPAPAAKTARTTVRKLAGHEVPGRLAPRRYRSSSGLEIWVGRSDEGNDYLSTRLARGKDLFFHLDGAPGSHVVLRTEGRDDPPSEALLDACELAVHFSKFKNASRADVHVVPIKNVRKPKGAKRGLVMVHGGKTIHLRRTPERLQRILDARIEDQD